MEPKHEQLKRDILFELGQLDMTMEKIKGVRGDNTEINKAALGTYLMNFYNGIENIMKRAAKEYYKKMPKGDIWHKQLLQLSSAYNGKKAVLFTKNTVDELYNYLTFRQVFIHGYGFTLSWDKMKSLADNIDKLWQEIKNQIAEFMKII